MYGQFSVAAATAVVGYDLATGTNWQRSAKDRALNGFALAGSAAAGDTKVDLLIDTVKVGEFYNTVLAMPTGDHLYPLGVYVPAGCDIHIYVTDAPATNPINGMLAFEDLE